MTQNLKVKIGDWEMRLGNGAVNFSIFIEELLLSWSSSNSFVDAWSIGDQDRSRLINQGLINGPRLEEQPQLGL